METMYDVQQLLKRFGIFIYTKDRIADLDLMQEEVKNLYDAKLISMTIYQQAILLIRKEMRIVKKL
ncbi:YqgQ family protein [Pseudogracilibacillus sp. ICA-222130]|uniref:YqgQ family protein n=1 Tax=Pseudogracilibacillus sp. ICA-222130 TaxID=3134655 RepID=UPI0030C47812